MEIMEIVADYFSPDRLLRLVITREDDDLSIGFDGYGWHTHGDVLAAISGLPAPDAVQAFVERILADDQVIAVLRIGDKIQDIWPTDGPYSELKHLQPGESMEFRRWSGIGPVTLRPSA
jgi:hypothetical protein